MFIKKSRFGTWAACRPSARVAVKDPYRKNYGYDVEDDGSFVTVQVAVVRRETDRAFQLMLAKGPWDHEVAVWLPLSVVGDQGIRAGQRDREVRIPSWLWQRILIETKEQH